MPLFMLKIGILIPVFNNLGYTKKCLANLFEILQKIDRDKQFGIILIDDGSKDGTSDWVRNNFPEVIVLEGDGNLWWSGGINLGARYAVEQLGYEYVLLWNNDIQINENYFNKICSVISKYDNKTIIGSKIYADKQNTIIWSMGGIFNPYTGYCGMKAFMVGENETYSHPAEVDWITGMGTLVPSTVIKEIGYWNNKDYPQYHGDTEFTYRAKTLGFKNVIDPELVIWNDITNTGLSHQGNFKTLLRLLSDKRSLYNVKVNLKFYKKYAKSVFAYQFLVRRYFALFGGFFKWKVINFFFKNRQRKTIEIK